MNRGVAFSAAEAETRAHTACISEADGPPAAEVYYVQLEVYERSGESIVQALAGVKSDLTEPVLSEGGASGEPNLTEANVTTHLLRGERLGENGELLLDLRSIADTSNHQDDVFDLASSG